MANKYKAILLVNQRISCSYPEQCDHNQMRSCKFKVHASTQQLTTFNLQPSTYNSKRISQHVTISKKLTKKRFLQDTIQVDREKLQP